MDFIVFDSSRILILRGGTLSPMGDFPESLSQAILVGIILVGRLGVLRAGVLVQPRSARRPDDLRHGGRPPSHVYLHCYYYCYVYYYYYY